MLNAGVVGCGRMGAIASNKVVGQAPRSWMPITHLGALHELDGVAHVCCCDVSELALQNAMAAFAVPRGYTDAFEMISREQLDILTIATRTPDKFEIINHALKCGIKAIHIEKPLCNSVEQLNILEEILSEPDIFVTFGCLRRYIFPYTNIKKDILSHKYGKLYDVCIEMNKSKLMWTLVHGLDTILFFNHPHEPVMVQAWLENISYSKRKNFLVTNDPLVLSVNIKFENGSTGRITNTSGDNVVLSFDNHIVDIHADGRDVLVEFKPTGAVYANSKLLNLECPDLTIAPGGTAAPIALLRNSLLGCKTSQGLVRQATNAMLASQKLIFDILWSHANGGLIVNHCEYPEELEILGRTDGLFA